MFGNLAIDLIKIELAVFSSQKLRNLEIELIEIDLAVFSSQELRSKSK